jgi:hypothetical protein
MADGNNDQLLGFWVFIRDERSARWAVKMSGVVLFLAGIFHLLLSLVSYTQRATELAVFFFVMALVLIFFSLRIRGGKSGMLPWLAGYLLVNSLFLFFSFLLNPDLVVLGSLLSNGLSALLLVSGLRGWMWLRKRDIN